MARDKYSCMRSSGHTMTMSPTSPTASKASADHVRMGLPAISTSCLPPSLPKRSPVPPARMMAAVWGFLSTLPCSCRSGELRASKSSSSMQKDGSRRTEGSVTGSMMFGINPPMAIAWRSSARPRGHALILAYSISHQRDFRIFSPECQLKGEMAFNHEQKCQLKGEMAELGPFSEAKCRPFRGRTGIYRSVSGNSAPRQRRGGNAGTATPARKKEAPESLLPYSKIRTCCATGAQCARQDPACEASHKCTEQIAAARQYARASAGSRKRPYSPPAREPAGVPAPRPLPTPAWPRS